MPDPATLALFALAAVVLIAVPGPNLVYICTRSLTQGRRAGLASALGVETGTLVHMLAAAAGLSALVASSALAFDILKYAGAVYLIIVGVRAFLGREEPLATGGHAPTSLARVFAEGVVVNVLNPKVALFFLAFLPQFVDPTRGAPAAQILILGVVFFALALCTDVAYALASGSLGTWLQRRPGVLRRQRYFTGSVYIALGVTAALSPGTRHRG